MCPPLPTRSTIAQCSSRCCKCVKSRSANSRLRSPQPSKTARIARSRLPLSVLASGACQSRRASSAVSQFPSLTPSFLTPFTRRMPAASSGLSKPASAASYASRRTAASRPLIVPAARPRFSRAIRNRVTTTLLKDSLGSEQYHWMNSSMACRYPRFDSGERKTLQYRRLAVIQVGKPELRFRFFRPAVLPRARVYPSRSRLQRGCTRAYRPSRRVA